MHASSQSSSDAATYLPHALEIERSESLFVIHGTFISELRGDRDSLGGRR